MTSSSSNPNHDTAAEMRALVARARELDRFLANPENMMSDNIGWYVFQHGRMVLDLAAALERVLDENERLRKEFRQCVKVVILPEDNSDFYMPEDEE